MTFLGQPLEGPTLTIPLDQEEEEGALTLLESPTQTILLAQSKKNLNLPLKQGSPLPRSSRLTPLGQTSTRLDLPSIHLLLLLLLLLLLHPAPLALLLLRLSLLNPLLTLLIQPLLRRSQAFAIWDLPMTKRLWWKFYQDMITTSIRLPTFCWAEPPRGLFLCYWEKEKEKDVPETFVIFLLSSFLSLIPQAHNTYWPG